MDFSRKAYPNGLKSVVASLKDLKATTVLMFFKVGSRYERPSESGISHFLEHMMFKGTRKRPSTAVISKELNSMGAEFNAFTWKEYTGYYAKVANEHVPAVFDILADVLKNSLLKEEEVEREKGVILEEIKLYEDSPSRYIRDLFDSTIFGEGPIGRLVIGNRRSVSNMNRKKIERYWRRHYVPRNMVVAVVGGSGEDEANRLIGKYFGRLLGGRISTPTRDLPRSGGPNFNFYKKDVEQTQIALGFPAYSFVNPKRFALEVMNIILGGNMGSRLFLRIRERLGLAYSIGSGYIPFIGTGEFYMAGGIRTEKVARAVKVALEEAARLTKTMVGAAELRRAKDYFKGRMTLSIEDTLNYADYLSAQELFTRKVMTVDEFFAKVDAVGAGDIRAVARDLFKRNKMGLAMIGPQKEREIDEIKMILKTAL